MNNASARDLWSKLSAAGLTLGDMPQAQPSHAPWYVRAMLGIAGLIAAAFLLGFVAAGLTFVIESKPASIVVGLAAIAAAYAVFRAAPSNDFAAMFALALSFAGQALVAFAIVGFLERSPSWLLISAMEALLAMLISNFIHRVACAYGAGFAFALGLAGFGAGPLAAGVLAAAVAMLWLSEARLAKLSETMLPIGYGLTLAFIQSESTNALALDGQPGPLFMGEALAAAALVACAWALLRRTGWPMRGRRALLSLASALVIAAASFKAPGVAGGLMIILLGYANGNRLLWAMGIAGLLFYVSSYYYLLEATLLAKSGILALSAAALLAVRWVVLEAVLPESDA